jgi:hypothetical protein
MPPQRHLNAQNGLKVRQRIQKACVPCRKRKIKCDGDEPCAACAGYGYECVYKDRTPQKNGSASAETSPSRPSAFNYVPRRRPQPEPAQVSPQQPPDPSYPESESYIPDSNGDQLVVHGSYLASETYVQENNPNPLLLAPFKTRFTSAHSAIAWPKSLGISLGMSNPPRLQSFAWNAGTRAEPKVLPANSIKNIVSLEEVQRFADVYFNEVHPFFGLMDQDMFHARARDFWAFEKKGTDFEACMCGVVALGSYFSGQASLSQEAAVVEQGRLLLDHSVAHPPAMLSVKHVTAWVLRTLYLRLTTRPHLSWMASCTAVHIAESIGLHREISESKIKCDSTRHISGFEVDLRRRSFWLALALNTFFAAEYGRTRVHIDLIGCHPITPKAGSFTAEVVAMLLSIPKQQSHAASTSDLVDSFAEVAVMSVKAPFLGLLRADVCFCIFRLLRSTNRNLPPAQITSLLDVIRVALEGATFLHTVNQTWWNITGTPFHSINILLSIGTQESFALLPLALETLKNVATTYNSHLSNEALKTAHALVQAARAKRGRELESLDQSLNVAADFSCTSNSSTASGGDYFEWPMDDDLGFADFVDLGTFSRA